MEKLRRNWQGLRQKQGSYNNNRSDKSLCKTCAALLVSGIVDLWISNQEQGTVPTLRAIVSMASVHFCSQLHAVVGTWGSNTVHLRMQVGIAVGL